jgi:hypothetical protein
MCFLGPFPCGLVAQGSVLGFASVCEQPCRLVHSDSVAYGVSRVSVCEQQPCRLVHSDSVAYGVCLRLVFV